MSHRYKQTEVGVIPEDWDIKKIDEIGRVTSGKRLPPGSSLVEHPTPFPYIRVSDMRLGKVLLSDIRFVPQSVFPAIKRYRIFRDDIFISVAGTLGIVGKVPPELDGANLTENADRITDIRCSRDFLLYVLMSPPIQNAIDSIRTVGAQPKLALTRIRQFAIPLPPSEAEQRAIAAALSDVDALVDGLDRLIAKKRDLKQAAMQQLLTGKTRLPGFRGEWQSKSLGDVVDADPENLGPDTSADFAFKYIALEDVERGFLRSHSEQVFAKAPSRARRKLRPSDILVSTVRPNLQSHLLFSGQDGDWVCSTGFCVVRCREAIAHPSFVFSQVFTDGVTRQIDELITGSNYPAISSGDVRSLMIPFPDFDEQAAIATVLSDMDAEIAALEARRDKTRDLKQAMMQELLTGKTRLVQPEVVHD